MKFKPIRTLIPNSKYYFFKGITTPSVKRQRQGPIGMYVTLPLTLQNRRPPPISKHEGEHHIYTMDTICRCRCRCRLTLDVVIA